MSDARVVLVTGGGSGIGGAVVRLFLARGWDVALGHFAAGEAEAIDTMRSEAAAAGRRLEPIALDVTNEAQCAAAAELVRERFGRLDALVCSAGATRIVPQRDLAALKPEDFAFTSQVNTVGPFLTVRACADMLKAARGAVVIVSSYGGVYGGGSSIAYAASKGATNTLTLSLARVLAPEVRVNAVCPALVGGGFIERSDPEGFAARARKQAAAAPLARVAEPEDVAVDIYWLAAETRLITGEVLLLDCGLHLNGDSIPPPTA